MMSQGRFEKPDEESTVTFDCQESDSQKTMLEKTTTSDHVLEEREDGCKDRISGSATGWKNGQQAIGSRTGYRIITKLDSGLSLLDSKLLPRYCFFLMDHNDYFIHSCYCIHHYILFTKFVVALRNFVFKNGQLGPIKRFFSWFLTIRGLKDLEPDFSGFIL